MDTKGSLLLGQLTNKEVRNSLHAAIQTKRMPMTIAEFYAGDPDRTCYLYSYVADGYGLDPWSEVDGIDTDRKRTIYHVEIVNGRTVKCAPDRICFVEDGRAKEVERAVLDLARKLIGQFPEEPRQDMSVVLASIGGSLRNLLIYRAQTFGVGRPEDRSDSAHIATVVDFLLEGFARLARGESGL